MHLRKSLLAALLAVSLLHISLPVQADDDGGSHHVKHVLLISVDGLHALDLSNYVATHSNSTLAYLSHHGVTYTNAATSQPSEDVYKRQSLYYSILNRPVIAWAYSRSYCGFPWYLGGSTGAPRSKSRIRAVSTSGVQPLANFSLASW